MAMVIGNDSDFMVFKDIVYSQLCYCSLVNAPSESASLSSVISEHPKDNSWPFTFERSSFISSDRVYRRKDLALSLGLLSENNFVDFCLLLGNDFTGLYKRSLFDDVFKGVKSTYQIYVNDAISHSEDSIGKDKEDYSDYTMYGVDPLSISGCEKDDYPLFIYQKILQHPKARLVDLHKIMSKRGHWYSVSGEDGVNDSSERKSRLSSSNSADLQYAIDFSYAMYNLEDIEDPGLWPDHVSADTEDCTDRDTTIVSEVNHDVHDDAELHRDVGISTGLATKKESKTEKDVQKHEVHGLQMRLTSHQKKHLLAWSQQQAALGGRVNLHADVIAYLKEAVRKDEVFGGTNGDINEVPEGHGNLLQVDITCEYAL